MIAPDVETRVNFYQEVAKANGSVMSLSELLSLVPEKATEAELTSLIEFSPLLNSRLVVRSGYVMERVGEPETASTLTENARDRKLANSNMMAAADFVALLRLNPYKMISVSGSTSYRSASKSRDLDLFCIAPSGELWLSLIHGLIMARAFSMLRRGSPGICFSCVMDEEYASFLFRSPQDPLFARDALQTKVIRGKEVYESLLQQAPWISRFYPARRSSFGRPVVSVTLPRRRASAFKRLLNRFLFVTVGSYIRAKSNLHNRRFRRLGETGSEFAVRSAEDHLIYESNRYLKLRRKYEATFASSAISNE